MLWYDLGVIGVLAFTTWRGSAKGFVWQAATIGALVLAFCFAGPASAILAPRIGLRAPLDRWVSMLILYAVFSFGCFLVARWLRAGIEKIKFEHYDSHLGAVLGFVKGATFCLVVTFFAVILAPQSHPYVLGSYSGCASAMIFDQLRPVVPDDYHAYLDESLKKLGQGGLDPEPGLPAGPGGLAGTTDPSGGGPTEPDPAAERARLLDGLVKGLPEDTAARLRSAVEGAFADTTPEVAARRMDELARATPETIGDLVGVWRTGLTSAERLRRRQLVFGIAKVFNQFPAGQQSIADEVAGQLTGVPPRVQLNVLEDWYADLLSPESDPDPATSPVTSLDERIARQLTAAEIPPESLDQALQDRLRAWR